MNLIHLNYFQSLAETHHYAKSAELLHTTPSNLSYAIKCLEEELGVSLFHKRGRNIELTIFGKDFLEYTARALHEIEEGKAAMKRLSMSNKQNQIRVAAFRLHAANSLIQSYNQNTDHPISVKMNHMKTNDIVEALKQNNIDLGFCTYTINDPDLIFSAVDSQKLVALVPKDHPLSEARYLTLEDIANHPIIIPHGTDGMHSRIVSLFSQRGLVPNEACKADSINAAANLSAAGQGITITIDFPVLSFFDLNIIPLIRIREKYYLYIAYRKDYKYNGDLNLIVEYLCKNFNGYENTHLSRR